MEVLLYNSVIYLRWFMLASGIALGASILFSDQQKRGLSPLLGQTPRVAGTVPAIKLVRFAMAASAAVLVLALIAEMAVRSWLQYQAFMAGGPGQYLLPPHGPISYFFNYATFHFVAWRILGLGLAALVFAAILWKWPKSAALQQRLNIPEAYLLAFGMAAAGWPYLLIYVVSAAAFYAVILLGLTLWATARKAGEMPRFPLTLPLTLALIPALPFGVVILTSLNLEFLRFSLFSF